MYIKRFMIHDNINTREAWILSFTTSETIFRFILFVKSSDHTINIDLLFTTLVKNIDKFSLSQTGGFNG